MSLHFALVISAKLLLLLLLFVFE